DFYTRTLGLRLVKVTINYDDPQSYHLYYGDAVGHPGTALTFFVWPGRRGTAGTGQVTETAFAVPAGAAAWWQRRLAGLGGAEGRARAVRIDGSSGAICGCDFGGGVGGTTGRCAAGGSRGVSHAR